LEDVVEGGLGLVTNVELVSDPGRVAPEGVLSVVGVGTGPVILAASVLGKSMLVVVLLATALGRLWLVVFVLPVAKLVVAFVLLRQKASKLSSRESEPACSTFTVTQ
jgi:hypothetical protein